MGKPTELVTPESTFADYLKGLARWPYPPEGAPLTAPAEVLAGWRGAVLRVLRPALLLRTRIAVTRVLMLVRPRPLRQHGGELKIHLGSGEVSLPGWRNVDLVGSRADHLWDLRRPLDALPGSVTAVFNEHFLEHLRLPEAVGMLQQSFALMRPGAVLRIGVPDFARYFEDYLTPDGLLPRARPGRPTAMVALNELVYSYGHSSLWDGETLVSLLTEIGFGGARVCALGESELDPVPDSAFRSEFGPTLYVEARKP